jgi:glycosidase
MALARYWLARGVAGFYAPGADAQQLIDLRKTLSGFAGQRILVGEAKAVESQSKNAPASAQLVIDLRPVTVPALTAAAVRPALEATQALLDTTHSIPMLASDGPTLQRSFTRYGDTDTARSFDIARTLAAILFTTRAGAMLYSGQELGLPAATEGQQPSAIDWQAPPVPKPPPGQRPAPPDPNSTNAALEDVNPRSLLNWYRQLNALRRDNRTIGAGSMIALNHDDQNVLVWVRKPSSISYKNQPIFVVTNLSAQPVTLSLKEDVQRLHLRGSFLRTVLRSDNAMGPMHLDGMTLAPHSVYIGELAY